MSFRKRFCAALPIFTILAISATSAQALDRTVCPSGCAYSTIGAALAVANPGDTIKVAGGHTYAEHILIAKAVTLIGGYDASFLAPHSLPSTIESPNGDAAVQITLSSGTLLFDGFDVTGGIHDGRGGGIDVVSSGGMVVLRNNHVYGNSAPRGGGIYVQADNDSQITVVNNEVDHNRSPLNGRGESFGGGIEADANQHGHVIVSGNNVHHNTITATTTPGNGGGGGIGVDAADDSAVDVVHNLVADNGGQGSSGQINGAGVYADARTSALVTMMRNRVHDNTGTDGAGVGLLIVGTAPATLAANVVTGNTAANGSVYIIGPTKSFNNIIAGNGSGVRAGVPVGLATDWQSTNDTIADNGSPGVMVLGNSTVTLRNAIVWGQSPALAGDATASYSDVQGGAAGIGNLDLNPLFADSAYHLAAESPVRNQGSASGAPLDDFEGDTRLAGDGVDMGGDEFMPVRRYLPLITR